MLSSLPASEPHRIRARAVMIHNGQIFLGKQAQYSKLYCLPGGRVEPWEWLREALSREIIEELGVIPVVGDIVFVQDYIGSELRRDVDVWFHVTNPQDFLAVDLSAASHGYENSEVGFYNLDTIAGQFAPKFLPEMLARWNRDGIAFLQIKD